MARNQSGFLGKFLDFIGIVDDDRPADTYDENEFGGRGQERYNRNVNSRPANRSYGGTSARSSGRPQQQRAPRYQEPQEEPVDEFGYSAPRRNPAPRREAPRPNRDDELENAFSQPSRPEPAPRRPRKAPGGTVMYTLFEWADCVDVIEYLIRNNSVVLNISKLSPEDRAHAMDTLSGAAYALRAMIKRSSEDSYLIAPSSTTVSIDAKSGPKDDDDILSDYVYR